MLRLFHKRRQAFFGRSEKIIDLAIEPLSSIRQTRRILRYTLTWNDEKHTTVYGHTRAKQTSIFLRTIWERRFQHERYLCTPRPLGYLPSYDLFLYEAFPGDRLRDLFEKKPLPIARLKIILAQTAAWLAALHAIPIPRAHHLRNASPYSKSTILSALLPTLSTAEQKKLQRNATTLFTIILPSLPQHKALIHRDPHIANIIIQPQTRRLAIIDYSESGVGQPMVDVATMIVHLRVALQPFYSAQEIEALSEHFLASYRRLAHLPRGDFRLHFTSYIALVSLHFWAFTVATNPRPDRYLAWVIREFQMMWSESYHLLQ